MQSLDYLYDWMGNARERGIIDQDARITSVWTAEHGDALQILLTDGSTHNLQGPHYDYSRFDQVID